MLLGSPPDMVHGVPPRRPVRPHILPCKKPGIGSAGHKGPKAAKLLYHRGQRFARRNLKFEEQGLGAGPSRGQGAHGPLQGSGQSPEVLPLVSPAGSVGAERSPLATSALRAAPPSNLRGSTSNGKPKSVSGTHPRRQRSRAADSAKLGNFLFPSLAERADCTIGRWARSVPARCRLQKNKKPRNIPPRQRV